MCVEVEHPLGLSELEIKVEMSRACCCSVSHADNISSITTIQWGEDAMYWAKEFNHHGENYHDIVRVLDQVSE